MENNLLQPSSLMDDTAAFRRFNRVYTRFVGSLQEGLLNTEYNLTEARIIYELGTRNAPKAKEITETLDMDPGYLSRLLGKFERAGLLKREASKQDNRYNELVLTAKGRAAFRNLNTRSEEQAHAFLESLSPSDRTRLIRSFQVIGDILTRPERERSPFVLRPHRIGDMGWIVCREGAVYAEEYGWDQTFEALVACIVADFITNFDPIRERCWIAEVEGQSAGHVFLVKSPDQPETAKLRLLFVEPSARGMGLGRVLVSECIQFARVAGYRRIALWTQSILVAAHRIYQNAGFRLVEENRHNSFGKDLIGQTWNLDLI
jgi:DNA-binding MarR family transcriptional regulator/GNAT superfamily N-acetyltransferase